MAKKATTPTKYKEGISKSSADVEQELVELSVEQAANVLEQGTLSVKSQLLNAQGEVKTAEIEVSRLERELQNAKFSNPFNVNTILSTRTQLLKAQLNVEAKKDVFNQIEESHKFLVDLKSELF